MTYQLLQGIVGSHDKISLTMFNLDSQMRVTLVHCAFITA